MLLAPGTRLGPHEILSALGAGGMGEVYRARDTKLGRDVALKILPDSFARDPERVELRHQPGRAAIRDGQRRIEGWPAERRPQLVRRAEAPRASREVEVKSA